MAVWAWARVGRVHGASRCGLLLLLATVGVVAPLTALADPVTLRLATVAPAGTAWARELAAFAREIEAASAGSVRAKIYYGGIAGDEPTMLQRIRSDQLDGAVGSWLCVWLAPSLKVTRIIGLFQSRDESEYVMTRLKPQVDEELLRAGFANLGEATLGPEVLLTRYPVHDLTELRRLRLWHWDLDQGLLAQASLVGLQVVPSPVEQAAPLYDQQRIDGFIAMPAGALAWQWATQARYLEDLRISYLPACVVLASRAFDPLPIDSQRVLRSAAAKLRARIDDVGRRQDDALLGGLLAKQGLQTVPVSQRLRAEFLEATREARDRHSGGVVPEQLLQTVLRWLADYRANPPAER